MLFPFFFRSQTRKSVVELDKITQPELPNLDDVSEIPDDIYSKNDKIHDPSLAEISEKAEPENSQTDQNLAQNETETPKTDSSPKNPPKIVQNYKIKNIINLNPDSAPGNIIKLLNDQYLVTQTGLQKLTIFRKLDKNKENDGCFDKFDNAQISTYPTAEQMAQLYTSKDHILGFSWLNQATFSGLYLKKIVCLTT